MLVFSALFLCFGTYAEIHYTKDYAEILKQLPTYTKKDIDGLVFRRQGSSPDSFMDALGLHQVLVKNGAYQLTSSGLIRISNAKTKPKRIPDDFRLKEVKPKSIIIQGKWIKDISSSKQKEETISNILGKNGRLYIDTDAKNIEIPIEVASCDKLAYYGAVAIPLGETVTFPDQEAGYPIWAMSLGKSYTKDYIMSEKAGGWYLEWHSDRPHFHMPLSKDSAGFYILGKRLNNEAIELTAFSIPFGKAVFTRRGAIHSDSGLIGNRWAVGYTTSQHYSTALLRNNKNEYIKISTAP